MEKVRAYAARFGVQPTTVIQRAKSGGGGTWVKWESGDSSPTLHTVDRIKRFMADNPPPAEQTEDAA